MVPLGLEREPRLDVSPLRGRLRAELGADGAGTPLVGIVSRLVPMKAHEVFLQGAVEVLRGAAGRLWSRGRGAGAAGDAGADGGGATAGGEGALPGVALAGGARAVYADLDLLTTTSDAEGTPW